MPEDTKPELIQSQVNPIPPPKPPTNYKKLLIISLAGTVVIFLLSVAIKFFILPTPPIAVSPPVPSPTLVLADLEPTTTEIQPTQNQLQSYTVPQGWQKYSDSEAGISINFPPSYTAKYNSNRGFGTGNFSAGSYLLDASNQKILDFFYFDYDGGSRRDAFYKTIDWDYTVAEISKHTISASDVSLNSRTFLKIVTNFRAWGGSGQAEKRVFFLLPQGNKMYYFTYPYSVESRQIDYQNILTVIATSSLSRGNSEETVLSSTSCYPRSDSSNKGIYWDSSIHGDGNMIIIQRTDQALKQQAIDKTKIEILGNPQKIPTVYFSLTDFDISIDSTQKGNYQDAFIIKIKKTDIDRIKTNTPSSIPSLAILVKINGGIETSQGESCQSPFYGYYVSKP